MKAANFLGTRSLLFLLLRKDRVKILIWLLSILAITLAAAAAYPSIYQGEQDIMAFALTMDNPAMIAMLGLGYDVADYTTATIFAHEMLLFTVIAVAVMNILIVGRATRADEEDGQLELVRSLPVGRLAYLNAAIMEIILINIALALFVGVGLVSLGLDGMDLESSSLFGAILGATGIVFAAITAVFAQLAETSRGATGLSFGALIAAYILRAIGDVNIEVLSYISPLGWSVRTEVFAVNHWWPVFISITAAVLLTGIAFYLNSIRDMGDGFIPTKKGNPHASALLKSPLGFVLKQQRANILSWGIGLFLLSAAFGAIMGELETYYGDMELLQAFFAQNPDLSMTAQFLSLILVIISLFGAAPAIMIMLRLLGEEQHNHTEHLYSRAISRTTLMTNYFLAGLFVTLFMQTMIALGLWSAGASVMEDPITFGELYSASLAYLPAMWVMVAFATMLIGAFPKITNLIWLYVVFCFLVVYLKDLLKLPDWLSDVSSFNHVPDLLNAEIDWIPIILLVLIAGFLSMIGLIGYKRRDIMG